MKTFQVLALSVSLFLARSALAAPVDNPVLEQNARDAQTLNSQFSNLQATDECQPGTVACIGDTIAFCATDKQFVASQNCPRSQSCFALPSVSGPGTSIACTSEKTALSIFAACGADGTNLDEQQASNDRNNSSDSNNNGDATVTIAQVVTVSVQSNGTPTTVGAVTQTISPSDASSLLGSLSTSTSTVSSSSSTSTSTSTSTSSSSESSSTSTSTSSSTASVSTLTVTSTSSSSSTTETSSSSSTSTSTDAAATTTAAAVAGDSGNAIGAISTSSVTRIN